VSTESPEQHSGTPAARPASPAAVPTGEPPPTPDRSGGSAASRPARPSDRVPAAAYVNLVVATIGFALTFWAWNLIAPLAGNFQSKLGFSSFSQSLLVAIPVIVGSLGRIPVGALTDKLGARIMFPVVSALTIVPVLLLIPAQNTYWALCLVGFFLGLGGTTFAIGIPLVNSWFPPAKRGLALGIFGMGMGGTALSGYFSPRMYKDWVNLPYVVVSCAIAAFCVLGMLLIRDNPDRVMPTQPLGARLREAGRIRVTWELSALYAIGFGGVVAFGVYLPTYLKTWYHLGATEAGTKAAGFALVTVIFRPFGGWLSDRIHPAVVSCWALGLAGVMAVLQAFDPDLHPGGTIFLLCMAAGLGCTSGSVFALVSRVTPVQQVGSVTGIVGAVGGLGGFVPPLVMGAIYTAKGSYAIGFMLLSDLALAGAVYAIARMNTSAKQPS
jgi:NNP family nitrate/nitrite transporter-like MFS transporter